MINNSKDKRRGFSLTQAGGDGSSIALKYGKICGSEEQIFFIVLKVMWSFVQLLSFGSQMQVG